MEEYIGELEAKYHSKIIKYEFRNKEFGWKDFSVRCEFDNGYVYKRHHGADAFFCLFRDNYTLCKPCYECKYKGNISVSDITIADAWGTEDFANEAFEGLSYVVCNNDKGRLFFQNTTGIIKKFIQFEDFLKHQELYEKSARYPAKYKEFLKIFNFNQMKNYYINNTNWGLKLKKDVFEGKIIPWGSGTVFSIYAYMMVMLYGIDCVCDINESKWGKEVYPGIVCIGPNEISMLDDVMIVIMIADDNVRERLKDEILKMGIRNCISYKELVIDGK